MDIPGLPRSTKPFAIFRSGSRRTNRPERSVVLPTASAAERASIAAAGNQRPAGPWVNLGRADCCSGPKQVALISVRRATLCPFWDVALGPSPRHLSGARTERLGDHISNHHLGESKGGGKFLEKILGRGCRDLCQTRGEGCTAILLPRAAPICYDSEKLNRFYPR